jgi:hypothetical protein
MADWLGEDHAAFGTDMNGLLGPALTSYADLRRVVDYWEQRRMSESRIRKLAIENYGRVLKQAMAARTGRDAPVQRRRDAWHSTGVARRRGARLISMARLHRGYQRPGKPACGA